MWTESSSEVQRSKTLNSSAPGPVGAQWSLLTARNVSAPAQQLGAETLAGRLALLRAHTWYPCCLPWAQAPSAPSPSGARGLWLERKLGLSEGAMEWGQGPRPLEGARPPQPDDGEGSSAGRRPLPRRQGEAVLRWALGPSCHAVGAGRGRHPSSPRSPCCGGRVWRQVRCATALWG